MSARYSQSDNIASGIVTEEGGKLSRLNAK